MKKNILYLKTENTNLVAAERLLNEIRTCIYNGNEAALDMSFVLGETVKKLKQDLINLDLK